MRATSGRRGSRRSPASCCRAGHRRRRRCTRRGRRAAGQSGWPCGWPREEPVNEHAIAYLNRLSDLLFILARVHNDDGRADVLWEPGASLAEEQ